MEIDLVAIKQWIRDVIKRAAASAAYMSVADVEQAYRLIDSINAAIQSGEFVYVNIEVPDGERAIVRLSLGQFNELQDLLDNDRKIPAIKRLREITRLGLRDAKYAVELPTNWDLTKYNAHRPDLGYHRTT